MTPTNLFNRYLWLLEQLSPNRRLTKEEIDRLWEMSSLNKNGEKVIPRRTFARMRDAIDELFGIRIACDRSVNIYYIADNLEEQTQNVRKFLLSAFSTNHLLRENQDLMPRILMDNVSVGGNTFLEDITTAMHDNRRIAITYQSFEMRQAREFEVCPGEFELRLVPTSDFLQALRSIGPDIEVTHPKWLRDQFRNEARTLMTRYGGKELP